jgi:hypothetical protein
MKKYEADRLGAVAVVESLRAGVPTRATTRELPDLRQPMTEQIRLDLQGFDGAMQVIPKGRLVWGQYGQGKTHALTAVEHIALDLGFAVSMVSLSREVSCHNLFQFYGRVAPRLRLPDTSASGLRCAMNKKSQATLPESPILDPNRYPHPLPAVVFEDYYYTTGEEQDLLYGDLLGIRLPQTKLKQIHTSSRQERMPKFATNFRLREHAAAYFGLMADAIRWCGYRGWVILIDEVELLGRLGVVARLQAYRHLNWLLNWSGTMSYPIYTVGAAATRLQDDIWYGRTKDDRTIMPRLAESRVGIEARLEMEAFFERAISESSPVVEPATEEGLAQLLNRVVQLHAQAYQWSPEVNVPSLICQLGSQTVRTYIRAVLEALDMQFIYQEEVAPQAEAFQEQTLEEDEDFFAHEEELDSVR